MNGVWTRVLGSAAVVLAVCAGAVVTPAAQAPAGGQPAEAPSAKAGTGVWSGVYTEEQAKRGEELSNKACTSCHGPDLSGGEAGPALVGLEFVSNWNGLSLGDFFERVRATMPADAPGSMTPQQTSDVTAYVLKLNKYAAGQAELPADVAALKPITIESQPPAQ